MALEVLVEGQLEIERGKLSREVASGLAVECQELRDCSPPNQLWHYIAGDSSTEDSPGKIQAAFYYLSVLRTSGLVAMQSVLDLHPHPESKDANLFIPIQQPGAVQNFHPDYVQGKQVIVHASDDGLFDYRPDRSDNERIETIDVNAGDVLWLTCPSIEHRGRNPSSNTRYVVVMSSNLPIE